MDVEVLIGEVARRHNILISPDDPIFATVTLNELVLAHVLEQQRQALAESQAQIERTTTQQTEAVKRLGERLVTAAAEHLAAQVRMAIEDALKHQRISLKDEMKEAQKIGDAQRKCYLFVFMTFVDVLRKLSAKKSNFIIS